MYKRIANWTGIVLVLFFTACTSTTTQTAELSIPVSADGPFFSGPNSLMGNYAVQLKELLGSESVSSDKIASATVTKVVVTLNEADSVDLSQFTSATLQFVSDNAAMETIAILNPIKSTGTTIELTASGEVDVAKFFKEPTFTAVLDWDFVDDDYRDALQSNVKMNLSFEIKN
jgi:hypothetical protein